MATFSSQLSSANTEHVFSLRCPITEERMRLSLVLGLGVGVGCGSLLAWLGSRLLEGKAE